MQNEVEAFLGTASTAGAPVTRIDTHAAIVFLSGGRALKIKRAVRLPFLDFSTLDRRKAGCEAELAVNKPFAPTIYRRVIPITRERDGSLKIDGAGNPVEWALEMRRFDENATLDHAAGRGAITIALASAVADAIAASHANAAITTGSGWTRSIGEIIQQHADAFRAGGAFAAVERDELENASRRLYAQHLPLIERRGVEGFVRRCHGDLHLANFVLIDGKPVLFDAIEFDERLANIDVLHDLSFTLMDLVRYGCVEAANGVLNRYLDNTPRGNLEALCLLPLFMSMRAAVRANVLQCRPADQALMERAKTYFALARSVLLPAPACMIAIGGLSGTGKSVVARALAPLAGALPGAVVLRSDVTRKRMLGVGELDRLPPSDYEPPVTAEVYSRLTADAGRIARQGHTVIVDAVFAREAERSAIQSAARQAGVPFVGIFLTADVATRRQRINQRTGDASDATAAVVEVQEEDDLGTLDWVRVDAEGTQRETTDLCTAMIPRACLRRLEAGHG
jgi:aminoglycoside phosphotransferase family enzyme/predicted kinase